MSTMIKIDTSDALKALRQLREVSQATLTPGSKVLPASGADAGSSNPGKTLAAISLFKADTADISADRC
jgi:hypothetical protein